MNLKSKSKLILFILISGAVVLFPMILHAQTYLYWKTITIDHTKVSATLSNFPV